MIGGDWVFIGGTRVMRGERYYMIGVVRELTHLYRFGMVVWGGGLYVPPPTYATHTTLGTSLESHLTTTTLQRY